MWHFGRDKKFEYKTDGYSLSWGYGREVLRTYTKSLKGQQLERKDRQEYPNKALTDAIAEKRNNYDETPPEKIASDDHSENAWLGLATDRFDKSYELKFRFPMRGEN